MREIISNIHIKCSLHSSVFFHKTITFAFIVKMSPLPVKDSLHRFVLDYLHYINNLSVSQKGSKLGTLFSFLETKKSVSCVKLLQLCVLCHMIKSKPLCATKDFHNHYTSHYIYCKDTFLFKGVIEKEKT